MVQKNTGDLKKYIASVVVGIVVSLLVMLVMITIAAILVCGEKIGENMLFYLCAAALIAASIAGATVAGAMAGECKIILSLINGAVFAIILMSINIAAYGGIYENIGPTMLLILGSGLGAGLLGSRIRTRNYPSARRTKAGRLFKVHK